MTHFVAEVALYSAVSTRAFLWMPGPTLDFFVVFLATVVAVSAELVYLGQCYLVDIDRFFFDFPASLVPCDPILLVHMRYQFRGYR